MKANVSGWFKQSLRHSNARRFGRAGGKYATKITMKHYETPQSQARYKNTQLFKFDELSPEAKKKAIEQARQDGFNDTPFLGENLKEILSDELKKNKIEEVSKKELDYSLGYSQGDGASFTGNYKWKGYDVEITRRDNMYVHSRSVNMKITKDDGNEDAPQKVYEEFNNIYKDICKKIEKAGYDEIEYNDKDETIAETLRINEYDYNATGKME